MRVLHLNDVPDDLYHGIEQLAARDQLPLPEEALRLLREAVTAKQGSGVVGASPQPTRSQREILGEILRGRFTPTPGTPDSVEMIREDRDR
jgi:hypothetical protein